MELLWYIIAALTSVIIAVLVYPLLSLFENESWYGKLFVQKSPGEVKRSLLMVFFMFAAAALVRGALKRLCLTCE